MGQGQKMKKMKHIPQLMLELYHLNVVSDKERRMVEEAMSADIKIRNRYEELKKSDKELRSFFLLENLSAIENIHIQVLRKNHVSRNRKLLIGLGAAAAVLLCVFIPSFFYFKERSPNNSVTGIPAREIEQTKTQEAVEIDEILLIPENSIIEKKPGTEGKMPSVLPEKIVIAPKEEKGTETKTETELKAENITKIEDIKPFTIADIPHSESGVRLRGGTSNQEQANIPKPQQAAANKSEQTNINIPTGLTFIFDSMFANGQLTEIIIPDRITSIGKNAFADNPILSVSIGANVTIHADAIPGNFANAYANYGRAAGIYHRSGINSSEWIKK